MLSPFDTVLALALLVPVLPFRLCVLAVPETLHVTLVLMPVTPIVPSRYSCDGLASVRPENWLPKLSGVVSTLLTIERKIVPEAYPLIEQVIFGVATVGLVFTVRVPLVPLYKDIEVPLVNWFVLNPLTVNVPTLDGLANECVTVSVSPSPITKRLPDEPPPVTNRLLVSASAKTLTVWLAITQ